jgi:hypothetical protein
VTLLLRWSLPFRNQSVALSNVRSRPHTTAVRHRCYVHHSSKAGGSLVFKAGISFQLFKHTRTHAHTHAVWWRSWRFTHVGRHNPRLLLTFW